MLTHIDWGVLGFDNRDGTSSTFWLGSAGAYTPCHYDTYGCNLVAQIYGRLGVRLIMSLVYIKQYIRWTSKLSLHHRLYSHACYLPYTVGDVRYTFQGYHWCIQRRSQMSSLVSFAVPCQARAPLGNWALSLPCRVLIHYFSVVV